MKENQILDQFEFSQTGELIAKKDLINDKSIWYKGLWGMILCVFGALFGLILVRISINQAKDALEAYKKEPNIYKQSSFELVKKGQRLAYIGVGIIVMELIVLVGIMSAH